MLLSSFRTAARKSMWRTQPRTQLSKVNSIRVHPQSGGSHSYFGHSTNSSDNSWPMIFAGIFGSFVAISLLQRLWPRRVEVIHSHIDPVNNERRPYS